MNHGTAPFRLLKTCRPLALLPLSAVASCLALDAATAQTAAPAPAAAASAPAPAEGPKVLPTVRAKVTAEPTGKESVQATTTRIGKGQQELRDVPQSITVVTERLIDDRNLDTLRDALRNTAGISFQAAEGGEEDIRLRGFSLLTTGDIFVDGLRDPAFYERDTFYVDRVEVLRGSASMLFGRGSTGGAVNQVSKLPLLYSPNEVAVTLGNGGYVRGTVDLNTRTGESSALRINAMSTQADNYGNKIEKAGIAPSFRWGIGTGDEFLASLVVLDNDNGINYGMPWLENQIIRVDPKSYYGLFSDVSLGTAEMATFSHTHRFGDRSELKTTLRRGAFTRDQRASTVRIAPASAQPGGVAATQANFGPGTVLRIGGGNSLNAKVQDLDNVLLQSDYDTKFSAFGLRHSVQAGVDFVKDSFVGYAIANPASGALIKPDVTVAQNRGSGWVDESLRIKLRNRDFKSEATGLYAQDLLQLSPSWKLLAGLRWDRFEGSYRTYSTTAGTLGQETASRSRADSLWSRRFGVLVQPTPTSSFHLSYGTSFNTSGDAYQYDALGANTPPEGSRNVELGAKLENDAGTASLRLALFHATKTNERNRDEESVNASNYILSGQRHAAGLEVDIAGRITPQWEVFASYAWIPSAKVDSAGVVSGTTLQGERVGSRPGLTPRHSGTVWSTYKFDGRLRVGGGINARSRDTPQLSTILAPSFVTADLMAEVDHGPVLFKLNLTNVTNKLYADQLYRGHYTLGKPRTVQLTTAVKF